MTFNHLPAATTPGRISHLERIEAEAIHILREAVAEARNPVMLFSAGKDSTVMGHVAMRAFYPARPPFPLLHIDSTWEFQSLLDFRDGFARENGFDLVVHANEEGRAAGRAHHRVSCARMCVDCSRGALSLECF